MLTEVKVEKVLKSPAKVEIVMDTLGDTLAKTTVKTLRDRKSRRVENL